MTREIVRVLRLVQYIGERSWVEKTVERSIHGTRHLGRENRIIGVTLTEYPEVLQQAEAIPLMDVHEIWPDAPRSCR